MKKQTKSLCFLLEATWKKRINNLLSVILLFFPSIELVWFLVKICNGGKVYFPHYAFFLAGNSVGIQHFFQAIYIWFMPVYTLIIVSNDVCTYMETGYDIILMSKFSKKNYFKSQMNKSFLYIFGLVFCALMLNLMLTNLFMAGGEFTPYGDSGTDSLFISWQIEHPLWANILFSIVMALFSGLIAVVGTVNAFFLKERKLVYTVTILFWFIPFLQKKSLVLLFQPYSEYGLDILLPLFFSVSGIYICYCLIIYLWEIKFGKYKM